MTTTEIGAVGEKIAAKFLKRNGYKILAKNSRHSHNEIDIIATARSFLVFVEVKTRSVNENDIYSPYGTPADAVTPSKQRRTVAAAQDYIFENPSRHTKKQPRMDVIEVYLSKETQKMIKINHIKDAFGA